MLEMLNKERLAQIALVGFLILTFWWRLSPQIAQPPVRFFGDFGSIYAIIALYGGSCGIFISKKWGWTHSLMGKAILMFSLGLLAQVFGQIAYAYFSFFLHIQVPYPSIGDVGYFGSIPLYIIAIIFIAQVSGVKIKLKSFFHQLQAIIIPLTLLFLGYWLFLNGYTFDWSNPLKIFLDFGYPLGQAIYISLAILTYLLTKGVLGGIMKNRVLFILFALCMQFLSDYTFLYQSSRGTWVVGGLNDYMYLISYLLMTLGLLQLKTVGEKLQ